MSGVNEDYKGMAFHMGMAGVDIATLPVGGVEEQGVKFIAEEGGETAARTLFHYTSEEGLNGIMKSAEIFPSRGVKNARYGVGQYFTDIAPGQMTRGETAFQLYGDARVKTRLTHFVEIDVSGLNIVRPDPKRASVFFHPTETNLNVGNRIVNFGTSYFR